jgi:hypothetical protein
MPLISSKLALIAGESALAGIVLADALPDPAGASWLTEIGKLPVQGLLAGVCGLAVWVIYRQSRDHAAALARENDLWRQELHDLTEAMKAKPCWWTMQAPHLPPEPKP